MTTSTKTLRICQYGHRFYISSNCMSCPTCEQLHSKTGFLALISAPARRALESIGVSEIEQLTNYSERDLLALHGLGPSTIPKLKTALNANNLSFKSTFVDE